MNHFSQTTNKFKQVKRILESIINNHKHIYSDFKTQEISLQLLKVSKLHSKILIEKRIIKHL